MPSIDRMMVGMVDRMGASAKVYAAPEASGGLDKTRLITIIVASIIALMALVWIFRETRKRD